MQIISIAGTTGRDAEYKTTQSGAEMCSTSVAVNGYANGEKVRRACEIARASLFDRRTERRL